MNNGCAPKNRVCVCVCVCVCVSGSYGALCFATCFLLLDFRFGYADLRYASIQVSDLTTLCSVDL